MRGSTLSSLLIDLRVETRASTNPAHNVGERERQVNLLQRVQSDLWEDFDWPQLRVERDIALAEGQRYYSSPDDLSIDRIERIELFENGRWVVVFPEITTAEYNTYNSDVASVDVSQRSWPIRRWRIAEDSQNGSAQIEFWPVPDRNADTVTRNGFVRLTGIRNLKPLIADNDRADLDDRLITMYAAAEVLAANGAKDAGLKLSRAKDLFAKLRGNLIKKRKFSMFGVGQSTECGRSRSPAPPVYRSP